MSKKRVIQPGKWWYVRFRRRKSFERITGYLTCKNAHHAGHSGFDRKQRFVHGLNKVPRYVARKWDLKDGSYRRFAYRFAEMYDLKISIRSSQIVEWLAKWEGILEIVECSDSCLGSTLPVERVVERRFPPETNEMEILAMEHELGE